MSSFVQKMLSVVRKPFQYRNYNATLWLILINVAVYFFISFYHEFTMMLGLFLPFFVRYKMYWQPVTYMFVHGSIPHLLFNMLSLLIFGMAVEKAIGSREFLLFYMLCGILSGVLSLVTYALLHTWTLLVGASGALYALLFLFAVVYPRSTIFIWGIIPVPSPLLVVIYAGIAVFNQVSGGVSTVAHLTHLWGFAIAWVYLVVRMGIHPLKVWKNAFGK